MPNFTTMVLADASEVQKRPAKRMRPKRKAWSEEAREAAAEARRSGSHPTDHPAGAAHNPTPHISGYARSSDPFLGYQQALEHGTQPRALTEGQRSALESIFAEHFGPAKKFDVRKLASVLGRLSKQDYASVQRLAKACRKADDEDEEKEKPQAKPQPEPGVEPPPPGIPPSNKAQVAGNKAANKARDLKHRAREASYNALDLDNSRKAHAAAADAHRAAAAASEKPLRSSDDPATQAEFRNSQHSHNLHAAYHDKMSHSSDEDRKASAAARVNKLTGVLQRKRKQLAPDDDHALDSPSRPERKRNKAEGPMLPKRKDWDHIGPASAKAHGLTGRARAAEKDRKLGDPAALHSAAARAHRTAAGKTSGADSERHTQAAEYHTDRASNLQ